MFAKHDPLIIFTLLSNIISEFLSQETFTLKLKMSISKWSIDYNLFKYANISNNGALKTWIKIIFLTTLSDIFACIMQINIFNRKHDVWYLKSFECILIEESRQNIKKIMFLHYVFLLLNLKYILKNMDKQKSQIINKFGL